MLKDYLAYVPFMGRRFILYVFLPDVAFQISSQKTSELPLRCVAVCNLKEAKSYNYLLDPFSGLKDSGITIEIYGDGPLKEALQERIDSEGLVITLCGMSNNINKIFNKYNLFIQVSIHEGFGQSIIEAMATSIGKLKINLRIFPL